MSETKDWASVEHIAAGFAERGAPLSADELENLKAARDAWDGSTIFKWVRSGDGTPSTYVCG
jgi:hypothetical protein